MNRMKRWAVLGAMLAVFAPVAGALDLGKMGVKKGKGGAAPFDFDAPAAGQSEEFVHVSGAGHLKGIKKLAIVNFTVEYTMSKKAQVIARRPGATASASAEVEIPDADPAILVQITDALYDRLVEDLKGAGIEMVPFETLKEEKRFQKLKGAQKESPWIAKVKDGVSVFVGARGRPVYLDNPDRADFLKGLGMIFGTNTRMHESFLANDIKGHLLSVNAVIDFADLKEKGSLGEADIAINREQFLHAGNTRLRFVKLGQPDLAMISIKRGVLPDSNPYTDVKVGRWKRKFWQWNADNSVESTRETTYNFNPVVYYQNCQNLLLAANGMMMTEFYKARGMTPPASATQSLAQMDGVAPPPNE
jgi:hypothetical protein